MTIESGALTDSGRVIGDPCEAIVAVFVFGPETCMKRSVRVAIDATWGTTHVVCDEHAPTTTADPERAALAEGSDA